MFKVCVLCGQDPISTNMVLVGLVVHMQHMLVLIHPLIGAHHCKIICVQGNSTFLKYSFHFYLKSLNLESSKNIFLIIFMLTTFTYLLTLYKPICIFTYVHIYLLQVTCLPYNLFWHMKYYELIFKTMGIHPKLVVLLICIT
jgi:hypothetical protein